MVVAAWFFFFFLCAMLEDKAKGGGPSTTSHDENTKAPKNKATCAPHQWIDLNQSLISLTGTE